MLGLKAYTTTAWLNLNIFWLYSSLPQVLSDLLPHLFKFFLKNKQTKMQYNSETKKTK